MAAADVVPYLSTTTGSSLVAITDPLAIDVTVPAPPAGYVLDAGSITDATPEFTLTFQKTVHVTAS